MTTTRKFLFIPAAHGPGYYNVHDLTCKDCRKDWLNNNSQGRVAWDKSDIFEGSTASSAVQAYIENLVAGGFEEGSFTPQDFHLNPCCK